jgi:hypothetical protein
MQREGRTFESNSILEQIVDAEQTANEETSRSMRTETASGRRMDRGKRES